MIKLIDVKADICFGYGTTVQITVIVRTNTPDNEFIELLDDFFKMLYFASINGT